MAVKRIYRVYYDKPDYIVPKEVSKIFSLMKERRQLMNRIDGTMLKINKAPLETKLHEVNADIELTADVITPKNGTWGIQKHKVNHDEFWVITITEPVEESLINGGQDDG